MPETCCKIDVLSELRGSEEVSEMGESTRLGGDLERLGGDLARLGFEGVVGVVGVEGAEAGFEADDAREKRDGRDVAVFVGEGTLGDGGAFGDDGGLLDDVDLRDPSLGVEGFEEGSFADFEDDSLADFEQSFVDFEEGSFLSFDFEDFFGVDASGGGATTGEVGSGNAPINVALDGVAVGGCAGVGAALGISFEGAVFESLVFAAPFAMSFAPAFFGVAAGADLGSGARSIKVAAGMLVFGAVNCPLAIWRARSFTLTNILTERRVHVQQNDLGVCTLSMKDTSRPTSFGHSVRKRAHPRAANE